MTIHTVRPPPRPRLAPAVNSPKPLLHPNDSSMTATKKRTLDDSALQHRLSLGSATAGGTRGTLTRAAVRYGQALHNSPDDFITRRDECLRELQLARVEMNKLRLMVDRTLADTGALSHLNHAAAIQEERQAVQRLRSDLQKASSTVACQTEYETLAKLAMTRHPTSREELQEQIARVEKELQATREELADKQGQVRVRQAQFQLLVAYMGDLKQSLSEPLELTAGEKVEPDSPMKEDESEDEEGELYGDL